MSRNRDLDVEAPVPESPVALRLPLLAGERANLLFYLPDHVLEALQIHPCSIEPARCLTPAVLVLPDPGGFLEKAPPFLGTVREDRIDHPVLNDRVRIRAEPCVPARLLHVPQAASGTVQEVVAAPVPVYRSCDLHHAEGERERTVLVAELDGNRGATDLSAIHAPLEDRLLHPRATDRRGALLAQNPPDGIGDVRFPAPVRTHNRSDPFIEGNLGPVGKGLEAVEPERSKLHPPDVRDHRRGAAGGAPAGPVRSPGTPRPRQPAFIPARPRRLRQSGGRARSSR